MYFKGLVKCVLKIISYIGWFLYVFSFTNNLQLKCKIQVINQKLPRPKGEEIDPIKIITKTHKFKKILQD